MASLINNQLAFHGGHHLPASTEKIAVSGLNVWYDYGKKHALKNVNLKIYHREVTALIGPSGCGKSTFLKCLNRINETVPGMTVTGDILLDGVSIHDSSIEVNKLRRRFGWVAQQPNPFPRSIFENVAYGARINGIVSGRKAMDDFVESCLRSAGLWDEVKDQLQEPGTELSGGQQQRLCIARALSTQPEVILMDEPCSALDPTATAKIEDLIDALRHSLAIIIVTHNMQQAARVSQRVAFFYLGQLMESGDTEEIMLRPQTVECNNYITGRFG